MCFLIIYVIGRFGAHAYCYSELVSRSCKQTNSPTQILPGLLILLPNCLAAFFFFNYPRELTGKVKSNFYNKR